MQESQSNTSVPVGTIKMSNDQNGMSMVLYGLPRTPETDKALFAELREIAQRFVGSDQHVSTFKYDQRPDCVAHGGVLYTQGGRKS